MIPVLERDESRQLGGEYAAFDRLGRETGFGALHNTLTGLTAK
jgi:hypothetical protein